MLNHTAERFADRYSRQIRFAPIGQEGQRKLLNSTALIVGCGALGASLAQHLTRAGVGRLRIADRDYVEPSNLQRQVLFHEADALAALPKAVAAAEKLRGMNSGIHIDAFVTDVNRHTLGPLIEGADIVLDGTDNAATRLLLSDACYERGIPFIYGGVTGAEGMSAVLVPGETACLRCLIGDEEAGGDGESCDTAGVLSAAVEFTASLQAIESVKYLTGNRSALRGSWVAADLWRFSLRELQLPKPSESCSHCGTTPAETSIHVGGPSYPVTLCGRDTVQVTLDEPLELDRMREWFSRLGCEVVSNRYLMKAMLSPDHRFVLFPDGRILVQGTSDPEEAMRLCRRLLPAGALR
ncbi:thiamine biosynthesis protein ThiF [Paenibacillus nanensis]|uniref:Thiamine biosynthesis protein ThiF n=1 Tax=Paenibacillus nanensis TaxID=393251 RepID=A0A3A1V1L0_9BACL|nr:ThiF family adenylyltransferase [Paenibacillus nanensis]RIX52433.1 thiamine biosynthesis protein ThiF [Paenibacillus nanensis]